MRMPVRPPGSVVSLQEVLIQRWLCRKSLRVVQADGSIRHLSRERRNASDGSAGDLMLSCEILPFSGEDARCKFSASYDIMTMGNRDINIHFGST